MILRLLCIWLVFYSLFSSLILINPKHELLNRLRSTMAANVLRVNTVHIVISFTISDITSTLVVLWNVYYTECNSKRNFVCEKLRGISEFLSRFDVHGSVHHSIIHTEITNKMQQCISIYYSVFIWSSTCFERHTAHHHELKNSTSSLWFYIHVRVLDVEVAGQRPATSTSNNLTLYVKPEDASAVLDLLMMGSVSLETCRASYKHRIINADTLLHLVGYFCVNLSRFLSFKGVYLCLCNVCSVQGIWSYMHQI
jgi:hypothetical protein